MLTDRWIASSFASPTPHEAHDLGRWTAVELLVNGRDLKDLVTDFERAKNYEPAGGYDSISLAGLQHARIG
jgi:hypothetical protein